MSGIEFYRHALGEAELESVVETLRGRFLTSGPRTEAFETRLAEFCDVPFCVGVNSCTAAMHLSLLAWDIGPGDEVITTPLTFMGTGNAILHTGADVVFADVNPRTGNIDPDAVEAAIGPKTRAILPVHLYGVLCDMERLRTLADRHDLALIEDAAHCVEGSRNGYGPGQLSDAACFSFYATKNMTSGEGGAVVLHDPERRDRLRRLRLHGMTRDAFNRHASTTAGYDMTEVGWKYNMDDIQAALLLPQIERLSKQREQRETVWEWYLEEFRDIADVELPDIPPNTSSAYHLFTVWLPANRRDAVARHLRSQEIGCTVNFLPVHLLTYYRQRYALGPGAFPVAEHISDRTLSLPFYPSLERHEVAQVASAIRDGLADG